MSNHQTAEAAPGKDLTVVIHDEDSGGQPHQVHAGPGTPVREVIDRFYKELATRAPGRRPPVLPGDRPERVLARRGAPGRLPEHELHGA